MKWVGWVLLITGAAGAYYRYTLYQASSQGNPGLANASLKLFDPASLVGLSPGTGLFDLPMGVDIAVLLIGGVLVSGRKLL
jgi:hypothetical protein